MAVAIVLDPTEVATGRTQLDISNWAATEVDFGDAAIEAYMAEAALGQVPVDFRVPNRVVSIPLRLRTVGATSFGTIRTQIQAKAALMQRQGGWLKRTSALGDVFAEVVSGTLHLGGSGMMENVRQADADATLTLECVPEWYQAEVDLGTTTETTAAELRKVMATVKGNYPARVRILVNELQGQNQRGVIWGLRSANYSSASTAALAYEADALTPLDLASVVALTGASGGNVVRHNSLIAGLWTPVVSTQIASGGAHLTHTGTYRAWARIYTTSSPTPRVRFVWDVGDLTLSEENSPLTIPAASNFYDVDLGEVRLDAPPTGTYRWQGMVQAYGASGGENVSIDKLWFVPVDDGYGILRGASSTTTGLATYSARDGFDQTAGALAGKTLPVGGTWAGVGSVNDFAVEATGRTAQRTAVSDATIVGRVATASTPTLTNVAVRADVKSSVTGGNSVELGVVARFVDLNNYMVARVSTSTSALFQVLMVVAGSLVTIIEVPVTHTAGTFYSIQLVVDSAGNIWAWYWPQGQTIPSVPTYSGQHITLATGGVLASGKVGIHDHYSSASPAATRNHDNFAAWVPTQDAVLFASQSAELRHDGIFREDSTGTAFGPVSRVLGDLPRLPPSGLEGRSAELFVKASRGDMASLPDTNIDDLSVQVLYRPSWLFLPEA